MPEVDYQNFDGIQIQKKVSKIDQTFKIVKIEFQPEQEIALDDAVSILGEFTKWVPQIM